MTTRQFLKVYGSALLPVVCLIGIVIVVFTHDPLSWHYKEYHAGIPVENSFPGLSAILMVGGFIAAGISPFLVRHARDEHLSSVR